MTKKKDDTQHTHMSIRIYKLLYTHMETKEKAYEYIAKTLGFPEYFGHNLDALYDALQDMKGPLVIEVPKELLKKDALGGLGEQMVTVFKEAAHDHGSMEIHIQ